MRTVTVPIIDCEAAYASALRRIRELWLAEDGTDAAAEREALITLVIRYESETEVWEPSTPQELVRSVLDSRNLTQKDLAPIFGSQGRVSEFLSGKRPLGRDQAVRLHREYRLPLDLLLGARE